MAPRQQPPAGLAAPAWFTALALAGALSLIYWPVLGNQFVWQDVAAIERSITPPLELIAMEGRWTGPQRKPASLLGNGTFFVEHWLWGLDPRGYHLVSLMSHAVSSLILWRLLLLLGLPGAAIAALIFAVHPVCVESVAWIESTTLVVSSTLCLASLLAFVRSAHNQDAEAGCATNLRAGAYYGLAVGCYVAALLGDPVSMTLPAVLIPIAWWQHGRLAPGMLARLALFVVLAAVALLARTFLPGWGEMPVASFTGTTMLSLALAAGRAFWFYVGKFCWPVPLIFKYPRWEIAASQPWQYVPLAGAFALFVGLWLWRGRLGRGACVGMIVFVALWLPQFIFVSTLDRCECVVADQRQYPALAALAALAAAAITLALRRLAPDRPALIVVAAIAVLAPLGVLTEHRVRVFQDHGTLDRDIISQNPQDWMAHHDLAVWLLTQGHPDQAVQAEALAIGVLEERRRVESPCADDADNLAGCYEAVARMLAETGQSGEASKARGQVISIREELVSQYPDVSAYRDHLAWNYVDLANLARGFGQTSEALEWLRKAVANQEILATKHPARYAIQSNLAANYVDIGLLELDQSRPDEATAAFTAARDLRQRLLDRFPHEPKFQDGLAWCYIDLALVETWLVRPEEALRLARLAATLRQQLVEEFPAVAEYRERLAILFSEIGLKESQLENLAAAEQAFQSALDLRLRLVQEYPDVDQYQDNLAANYVDIGGVQHVRGQDADAEKSYRAAIDVRDRLARNRPENKVYALRLAGSHLELAILKREAGQPAQSLASCREAIVLCQKLIDAAPQEFEFQVALSWAHENLGLAQIAAGQLDAAVATCETVLRMSEDLVRKSTGGLRHRVALARAHTNLAKARFQQGQVDEAELQYRQALEIRAQLIQDGPAIDQYKHVTAQSCHALGDVLRATGRLRGAAALYQAGAEINESLVDIARSTTYRSSLREDLIACAEVAAELGDWSQSAAAYTKAASYDSHAAETAAARALAQLAAGEATGYRATCAELLRNYATDASPDLPLPVALALIVGQHEGDADAMISIAKRAAESLPPQEANVLLAAAQYRAGKHDAATGLAESLSVLDDSQPVNRVLVLRLVGAMLLAQAYRDQNNAAALAAQLERLDDLIIEALVSPATRPADGLPTWSARWAVEVARRELLSLRQISGNP